MHRHQHGYRHEHQGDDRRHMRGGFGFGGQNRHRGLHGGRTRRVFDQGDLRYVLLQLIADKPSHGYELIKAIEEKFGGTYSPSPGIIYPTLTLLEERATRGSRRKPAAASFIRSPTRARRSSPPTGRRSIR